MSYPLDNAESYTPTVNSQALNLSLILKRRVEGELARQPAINGDNDVGKIMLWLMASTKIHCILYMNYSFDASVDNPFLLMHK